MKKQYITIALIFFIAFPLAISNSYAYDIEENQEATWKVTKYEVDAFLHIQLNTMIRIRVVNSSENAINVMLFSIDRVEEESLVEYDEDRCRPFIENPSYLNSIVSVSTEYFEVVLQEKEIFGYTRNVTSILMQNMYIQDVGSVDYIIEYDLETGLLIKWNIIQDFSTEIFQTTIELIETDFFIEDDSSIWDEFYATSKYWIIPISVIGVGMIGAFIVFRLMNTKQTLSFKFPSLDL